MEFIDKHDKTSGSELAHKLKCLKYALSGRSIDTHDSFVDWNGVKFGSKAEFNKLDPIKELGSEGYCFAKVMGGQWQLSGVLERCDDEKLDKMIESIDGIKSIIVSFDGFGFDKAYPKMWALIQEDKAKSISEEKDKGKFVGKYIAENKKKDECRIF